MKKTILTTVATRLVRSPPPSRSRNSPTTLSRTAPVLAPPMILLNPGMAIPLIITRWKCIRNSRLSRILSRRIPHSQQQQQQHHHHPLRLNLLPLVCSPPNTTPAVITTTTTTIPTWTWFPRLRNSTRTMIWRTLLYRVSNNTTNININTTHRVLPSTFHGNGVVLASIRCPWPEEAKLKSPRVAPRRVVLLAGVARRNATRQNQRMSNLPAPLLLCIFIQADPGQVPKLSEECRRLWGVSSQGNLEEWETKIGRWLVFVATARKEFYWPLQSSF